MHAGRFLSGSENRHPVDETKKAVFNVPVSVNYGRRGPCPDPRIRTGGQGFVYQTANRDEMMPRKPLPEPWPEDLQDLEN